MTRQSGASTEVAERPRSTDGTPPVSTAERIERLYRQHSADLLRRLLRLTLGDRREAEDYLQETFLRAWRFLQHGTVDPATVRPWLFTVARNVVLDAARARQARPSEVFSDVSLVAEPTNDIDQMLRRHAVRRSLSELSPPHRNALIQAYYHDRSTQEAAEVLGIPEGTVKSRIHYGLRCLREASTMSMAEA